MIIGLILIAGIGISLFVVFHLLRQHGLKSISRRIALTIQLLWVIRFSLSFAKGNYELIDNPHLVIYDQSLYFLDGLLGWLYIRSLLKPESTNSKLWLHFIPFGFAFLYSAFMAFYMPEYVVEIYNQNVVSLSEGESFVSFKDVIFITILLGINIIYLIKSVKITNSYNDDLKRNLSNIDHLTVNWVKKFQRLWIVFFVIPVVIYFLNYMYPVVGRISFGNILVVLFVLLSIVFNTYLLEQVYKPVTFFKEIPNDENDYQNDAEQSRLLKKLEHLLGEEKYYLDDELSLSVLAQYMEMKPTDLTALIKQSVYENFYDLINSYRIDAVKNQLKTSNEQIIQLAYQNGFRSKSTFNKIFKEKTGMTPKEYRLS